DAGTRPEQAHVVVDLGDGADGGARVAAGGFLLDRDGGGQAVDRVDVRLAHQFEELPRVGGQALDVATLALGVDRVERERGFARPGQPGDHGQRIAWDDDIHVLQIVLAGAANVDGAGHDAASYLFSGCSRPIWQ